jgi:hypothetical protein
LVVIEIFYIAQHFFSFSKLLLTKEKVNRGQDGVGKDRIGREGDRVNPITQI